MTIGETKLEHLLRQITPVLHSEVYVFCTLPIQPALILIEEAKLFFREDEGITLILPKSVANKADLESTYASRMITLNIHSSLEAVGFLAAVTAKLAEHSISVNPVSAYYHDHLFVPEAQAEEALELLKGFSEGTFDYSRSSSIL